MFMSWQHIANGIYANVETVHASTLRVGDKVVNTDRGSIDTIKKIDSFYDVVLINEDFDDDSTSQVDSECLVDRVIDDVSTKSKTQLLPIKDLLHTEPVTV